MKFGLKTIFAFVFAIALLLTAYRIFFAPPVLVTGMKQDDAIAALRRANAADMIKLRVSSSFTVSPIVAPPTVRDIEEYHRVSAVPYSEANFLRYWYLPTVGRFETHFRDGKLKSIVRWDGTATKELDRLTLEFRPDDPNGLAGLPIDF